MVADLATCAETLPPLAMMRVTGLEPDRPLLPTVDRIDPWPISLLVLLKDQRELRGSLAFSAGLFNEHAP
jgi:hypothetical protein